MVSALHRHDISDENWAKIAPHLPGKEGDWGRVAKDNRKFINAVFWVLRTGAPWRDLPPEMGDWKNTHRRFCRWRDKRIWEKLLEQIVDSPDFEWLMIDSTHIKVHPHAAGARGGNQDMARSAILGSKNSPGDCFSNERGSTPSCTLLLMRLVCQSELLSQKVPELIARRLSA